MSLEGSEQPVHQAEISDEQKRPPLLPVQLGPVVSEKAVGSLGTAVIVSLREDVIMSVPSFFGSGSMNHRCAWIDLMVLRGTQSGGFGL
jgi:hypothetical protein